MFPDSISSYGYGSSTERSQPGLEGIKTADFAHLTSEKHATIFDICYLWRFFFKLQSFPEALFIIQPLLFGLLDPLPQSSSLSSPRRDSEPLGRRQRRSGAARQRSRSGSCVTCEEHLCSLGPPVPQQRHVTWLQEQGLDNAAMNQTYLNSESSQLQQVCQQ